MDFCVVTARRIAHITPIKRQQVFDALPLRAPDAHKGSFGRVLCVCGCADFRGAAALSCLGALRTGAGLVTLAAEECVICSVAARILEATFLSAPSDDALARAAHKSSVCLAGCGRYANAQTAAQMMQILQNAQGCVILDAGGLCSLAGQEDALRLAAGRLLITPHIGEMAVLTGLSIAQVQQDAAHIALDFAQNTGAVVVLKSHRTLVATPEGTLYENRTGNAGLARGGSGDVLAGMLAGLAATGLSPVMAGVCGVFLHGAAADLCAARCSMQGMLPEDLLRDVCTLFLENERAL
ncbi:MAG: NAD(P)H-hydrate dehydratase [Ruthenibacterium sp.]